MSIDYSELTKYFNSKTNDFVSLITQLVEMQSYSGEVDNIDLLLDFIEHKFSVFKPIKNRIKTKVGDILVLDLFALDKNPLVFLAHVDTVRVSEEPIVCQANGNKLFGNGCYDMKSAVAIFYFVVEYLSRHPKAFNKGIRIICSPDEETGSKYSMDHLIELCTDAKAVFIPEPSCADGSVKLKRKGVGHLNVFILGKTAHSGIEPEAGIDANKELITVINKIYKILEKYPTIHFNPGIISGGVKINVVSPDSFLDSEMRSFSNDDLADAIAEINEIKSSSQAVISIDAYINKPALEINEDNLQLFEKARQIAGNLGYDLRYCATGGASDGSNLSAEGIPILDGLGIKGGGAHTIYEYIETDDFPFRAALLTALCYQ